MFVIAYSQQVQITILSAVCKVLHADLTRLSAAFLTANTEIYEHFNKSPGMSQCAVACTRCCSSHWAKTTPTASPPSPCARSCTAGQPGTQCTPDCSLPPCHTNTSHTLQTWLKDEARRRTSFSTHTCCTLNSRTYCRSILLIL